MLLPEARTNAYYWLVALLLLWAVLLFGGFALGTATTASSNRIPTPARMGSSFVLVCVGWSWYWIARRSRAGLYAFLIALGMTFGFVGDLFMAGLIPFGESISGGMGSFGIGHIAYLIALITIENRTRLNSRVVRWTTWFVWQLIGVACWYVIVYRNVSPSPLVGAALVYVLLLASTAGCASGLAVQARVFWPLACGTALFFVSDLMIALEQFARIQFPGIDSAIWLTYGPGQMLIVCSTASALAVIGEPSPQPGISPAARPGVATTNYTA